MDRWYAWVDNQVYGPYQPEQLSEFIQPEILLCREGTEEWKSAKDFQELAFLWSGIPVELPPNIGWMVRKAGSGAVLGPFSKTALMEMIQKRDILPNDSIKHSEWEDWEILSKTKLVAEEKPALKPGVAPPSPEGFMKVVRDSSDDELQREYKQNYKLYARRERKILKEELLRRGLIKKGLFGF